MNRAGQDRFPFVPCRSRRLKSPFAAEEKVPTLRRGRPRRNGAVGAANIHTLVVLPPSSAELETGVNVGLSSVPSVSFSEDFVIPAGPPLVLRSI